ncbi:MAG: GNAT family N-acetyltransferase [candidate division NC10 bacterium]|nr:GNAT family N-acetyltransferase [candidate division NC10 bacterium]MBI3003681.1 GNAT family N-acetyltransferase [candidate division NC10 bacterium]
MLQHLLEERYPREMALRDGTTAVIRPLAKDDKEALLAFFRAVPQEERLFLKDDVTDEAVIESWVRGLDYGQVLPLVAEVRGRIVADATLHQQKRGWTSHVGKVRIVTHPDFRHKGLASGLIKELIEVARDSGLELLDAEFMSEQVGPMQTFTRLGFYRVATLPRHVRDQKGKPHDFIVMVYDLVPDDEAFAAQ